MAVVVKNGVISKVQKIEKYQKEADVQEDSLDGHYVTPGLIDAHVHLSGGRAGLNVLQQINHSLPNPSGTARSASNFRSG